MQQSIASMCVVGIMLMSMTVSSTARMDMDTQSAVDDMIRGDKDITLGQLLQDTKGLYVLKKAVWKSDLVQLLQGDKKITLFAPPDDAWIFFNLMHVVSCGMSASCNDLAIDELSGMKYTDMQAALSKIVKYHAVEGLYRSTDLKNGMLLKTYQGEDLAITIDASCKAVVLNAKTLFPAYVLQSDIITSNGIMHIVNNVVLPPSLIAKTFVE